MRSSAWRCIKVLIGFPLRALAGGLPSSCFLTCCLALQVGFSHYRYRLHLHRPVRALALTMAASSWLMGRSPRLAFPHGAFGCIPSASDVRRTGRHLRKWSGVPPHRAEHPPLPSPVIHFADYIEAPDPPTVAREVDTRCQPWAHAPWMGKPKVQHLRPLLVTHCLRDASHAPCTDSQINRFLTLGLQASAVDACRTATQCKRPLLTCRSHLRRVS